MQSQLRMGVIQNDGDKWISSPRHHANIYRFEGFTLSHMIDPSHLVYLLHERDNDVV